MLLGGHDARDARASELRRQVGVVTQDVRLFEGTVRDNLTLLDHTIPDGRLIKVVEELGLGPWYADLPEGLDTLLRSEGAGMSAGEAQLLAFARVFLRDPRVVVLDEASSRIDPGTERLIGRAVDKLVEGRTVIVIAHRLSTLDRCDDVMVLEAGTHRRARGARAARRRPGLQVPAYVGGRCPGGAGMSAWRSLLRIFWALKWPLLGELLMVVLWMVVLENAVGLIQREVFDQLTGEASVTFGIWELCAILVAIGALDLHHVRGRRGAPRLQRLQRRRDAAAQRLFSPDDPSGAPLAAEFYGRGGQPLPG